MTDRPDLQNIEDATDGFEGSKYEASERSQDSVTSNEQSMLERARPCVKESRDRWDLMLLSQRKAPRSNAPHMLPDHYIGVLEEHVQILDRLLSQIDAYLSGEPASAHETSGKLMPCWCPYCGEPHGVRRAETDPRGTQCQHDRFKSGFTLQWLGSTPDIRVNTHRFQCRICRETFDLAVGEAQLSSAVKASGEPT